MPKTTGGVNFLNISSWNKATLCKLLWTLSHKKDKLWIKWVHMYYVKGKTLWEANTKQASWLIKKIYKATEYMEAAGYTEDQFQRLHYFSVKKDVPIGARGVSKSKMEEGSFQYLFFPQIVAHYDVGCSWKVVHEG